jgi:CRISPR-associated protein Cas1
MSTLFVDRRGVEIGLESGAIVFRENGKRVGTVPVAPISRVFLRGDVRLSAALLGKLGEHGVGVVVLSGRQGKPSMLLARPHNDAERRVRQWQRSLDEAFGLRLAKSLITRKLQRQIEWFDELRQTEMRARYALTHAAHLLGEHEAKLSELPGLGQLRGLEGSAAACYFAGLRALVPESWQFRSRNRRPPRDPFNALLSLGYTLAHAELVISLHGAGFDPYVGFYHQLDFGRESLASDLLEPLRPLVDRFVLRLVREQILRPEHFSTTESGCLLSKAGRVHFYAAYEGNKEFIRYHIGQETSWLSAQMGDDEKEWQGKLEWGAPAGDAEENCGNWEGRQGELDWTRAPTGVQGELDWRHAPTEEMAC